MYNTTKNFWWQKGLKHPTKKEKIKINCLYCGKEIIELPCKIKGSKSRTGRKYCSIACFSKHRRHSKKTRLKMSLAKKGKKGCNWKGGISKINKRLRAGIKFRLWREAVFARDNWTCQKCKKRGGELHPHHIKEFAKYPDERFNVDNGITLCPKCHIKEHKNNKGFKIKILKEQAFIENI